MLQDLDKIQKRVSGGMERYTCTNLHPLIYWDVAQRNSRNQPRGTLIVKSRSVDKVVYGDWLCNYVVHAILAQWPSWAPKIVDLQQDNVTPNIKPNDPTFMAIA
jgi:hypothetical protein